jgi:hypothetical protein
MRERKTVEYIHEGRLVAEVDVTALESDSEWSPFYRPDDVRKLEAVRDALRRGDLKAASKLARVFELKPVAAE